MPLTMMSVMSSIPARPNAVPDADNGAISVVGIGTKIGCRVRIGRDYTAAKIGIHQCVGSVNARMSVQRTWHSRTHGGPWPRVPRSRLGKGRCGDRTEVNDADGRENNQSF